MYAGSQCCKSSNTLLKVFYSKTSREWDIKSPNHKDEPVSGSTVHLRAVTSQIIASPFTIQFCVTVHSR